jgi:hypothetical protein
MTKFIMLEHHDIAALKHQDLLELHRYPSLILLAIGFR